MRHNDELQEATDYLEEWQYSYKAQTSSALSSTEEDLIRIDLIENEQQSLTD
jgi:hypothetical protein